MLNNKAVILHLRLVVKKAPQVLLHQCPCAIVIDGRADELVSITIG